MAVGEDNILVLCCFVLELVARGTVTVGCGWSVVWVPLIFKSTESVCWIDVCK